MINQDQKPENPPAFPSLNAIAVGDWKSSGWPGATMWDFFAAHALGMSTSKLGTTIADVVGWSALAEEGD